LKPRKSDARTSLAEKAAKSFRKWHFLIDIARCAAYHYDWSEIFGVCERELQKYSDELAPRT
jgi:hypothetical protein